ncbi:MlaD family protein [Streptomyces sp. NPDC005202]|uniref:MlaD family protein n=1 Tax=Streptomyces sp. NPDC005202 TaxID=3157021 RepID=UPI0033B02679
MSKLRRLVRAWERMKNEPGLSRNVAVTVALVVLAGVAGGIILTNQRFDWPWEDKFPFYATLQSSPGVSPGNGQEVRIAGVQVGEIRSTEVDDHGNAKLGLAIDPQYHVYDNAKVVLRPKSPLNEMYVELNPGGPPGKELKKDGVLPVGNSTRPIQVDEVLGHLDVNTREALTSLLSEADVALAKAPNQLPEGVSATDQVARNLRPVAEALQTRKDTLAKLVTSLQEIASSVGGDDKRLSELATALQRTLHTVGKRNDTLDATLATLPDVTRQLKQATDAVQGLSNQLDPTLDNLHRATGTLPDSLSRLTKTVDQVGNTVDSAAPVVAKARPVVADLRPFVGKLNGALPSLRSITKNLDPVTGNLVSHLNDLGAFVVQTRSVTSLTDSNAGVLRAQVGIAPSSIPTDLFNFLSTPKPGR